MIHTYLYASLMADDFVPFPKCICAYVLCNMPVHHVASTLNTLNTRQVRQQEIHVLTELSRTRIVVYTRPCVLSYDETNERRRRGRELLRRTSWKVIRLKIIEIISYSMYFIFFSLSLSPPLSFSPFYYLYLPTGTLRKRSFLFFVNLGRNWRAIIEIISPSTFISTDAERKWVIWRMLDIDIRVYEKRTRRDITPRYFSFSEADPPHSLVHKTLDRDHCVRGSCMRTQMILANRICSRDK